MTDPAIESGPPGSRLSTAIARQFLRGGNYPWLKVASAIYRERSRRVGGHRFSVTRPGGVTLDAWFCPAPPHAKPHGPKVAPPLPVLISHGIFEFKERYFDRAAWLNARGHDVILFDHRTHGRSTGKRLTMGVLERDDIAAVLDVAETRGLLGGSAASLRKVVTLGFSLGGGTVLQHAAMDDRVAGVIALAPFADFTAAIETFRRCFAPWLDKGWVHAGFDSAAAEAGFEVQQASALDAIERITVPILLVEAGKDTYLPPARHTAKLRQRRGQVWGRTAEGLTVLNIPDAAHISLVRKRWPRLDAGIGAFLDSLNATRAD
ncbi:MAG: alpha/beta fold hydrolase [Planctomycetota bacterium]